ncbi:SIMPL domain-containing protein [Solirubrobacter phytolaccae]|uniref:SIMPL domain-containing protein n=1 Tax=Solirubrobacter phytolaccae TaxID=1404360 RepID=A0A9X3N9Q0_9ACTN|nr:SIMPL domain-containing protein [Solirubrobacter phytolaccae]MDA0182069.1 SIMPL domain-containing protein [Solirubrobacter phytolaccae]
MPKSMTLVAVVGLLLLAAPAAQAQAPATLSATGLAQEPVTPEDNKSETSIREALEAARAKALPRAITDAKRRAQELATAGSVTLGTLVGITDGGQASAFGPYVYGSFGPNKYCGNVANYKTVTRNGRRQRVRVKGTHRVCRYPRQVYASATVTFTIS